MTSLVLICAAGLLRCLEILLLLALVYHYLFVIASAWPARDLRGVGSYRRLFAIVIPAHNEASVIAATVMATRNLDYPADRYRVHVVADHCSDGTAEAAAAAGALVHSRTEAPSGRKGYALAWIFERLLADERHYEAFVVLDADSLVDPQLLTAMNAGLEGGVSVLQGQRIVSNAGDSTLAAISAVDQRLNNRLRNQARTNLGWACRLMGDAMCFARQVIETKPLGTSSSLVEDREYGARLLLDGIHTTYLPEARVTQQAAVSWQGGRQQRLRWYRGAVEVQRRLARQLLRQGLRDRDLAKLDGGIELLMPAYTTLAALTLVVAVLEWLLLAHWGAGFAVLASLMLGAWVAYPLLGLVIDRAPRSDYVALLYGPVYAAWRVWLAILTRVLGQRIQWVRTERREEIAGLQERSPDASDGHPTA